MAVQRILQIVSPGCILLTLSAVLSAQFTVPLAPPYSPIAQFPQIPIHTGNAPAAVAVGNFHGGALPEVAVANQFDGTVVLIQSNGTGGYTTSAPVAVGAYPSAIIAADFNNDGLLDLAVANQGANTVTVLLNNKTSPGTFTQTSFQTGTSPSSLAAGYFNQDAYPDIVVSNRGSNNVTVLINNSQSPGVFLQGVTFNTGASPNSVAVGDFNGDGFTDLVTANQNFNKVANGNVTLLIGNGSGGFKPSAASPPEVGFNPSSVVVADFNGDHFMDLAIADSGSNTVTILLGNGTGGFAADPVGSITTGTTPYSMAVADFNGDGYPDLAVANSGSNTVTVLLSVSKAPGTFLSANTFPAGTFPVALGVGDFSGDGLPGLAIANSGDGDVGALTNRMVATPVMESAASFLPGGPVAPGSLVSIFGSDAGATVNTAPVVTPEACLDGLSVTMTDSSGTESPPLPLFYAGPAQINAQVPSSVAVGAANFTLSTFGATNCTGPATGSLQQGKVTVNSVAPALFSANGTGMGVAAAQLATNLVIAPVQVTNNVFKCPAAPVPCTSPFYIPAPLSIVPNNTALVLYGTGIRNRPGLSTVMVNIGGVSLAPFYAGLAPGFLGEDQINVSIPSSFAGAGVVSVTVSITGGTPTAAVTSNAVTLCFENSPPLPALCGN